MKYSGKTVHKKHYYTFAEIMMVVAIFIIILAMIMSAWMSSGNKAQLDNAARIVSAQLNLARAKAIGERKDIGVYFNKQKSQHHPAYGMVVCEEGDKNKILPGEEYVTLPGGILFSTASPGDTLTDASWVNDSNSKVVFRKDGSVTGTAINDDKKFYLAPGNRGTGKLSGKQAYYEIVINEFTGKVTMKLQGVN